MDASTQFSINSNYNQFHQIINVPKLKSLFVIRKQYCFPGPRKRFVWKYFLCIFVISHIFATLKFYLEWLFSSTTNPATVGQWLNSEQGEGKENNTTLQIFPGDSSRKAVLEKLFVVAVDHVKNWPWTQWMGRLYQSSSKQGYNFFLAALALLYDVYVYIEIFRLSWRFWRWTSRRRRWTRTRS